MECTYIDQNEYFDYYNTLCNEKNLRKKYPLFFNEVETICQSLLYKIDKINSGNFFKKHVEIMGLDVQLKLL